MAKKKGKRSIIITSAVLALVLGLSIVLNVVALSWSSLLEGFLGTVGSGRTEGQFMSAYASDEDLQVAQRAFNLQVAEEGAVLMKNENNALPLAKGSRISLFSRNSVDWVAAGRGSGAVSTDASLSLKTVMESAGFEVNPVLWDFYLKRSESRGPGSTTGGGNIEGDWKIGETPLSAYTADVKNSYANDYKDAAIIVISRNGGEGSDLPTNMDKYGGTADEHYLELNSDEKDLLAEVASAGFQKVIVIVNCANPLELGFVNDPAYGIDACLRMSGTGNNGINALAGLINGTVNPSGRLVDTYVYDNFSAPAMQNFGDFRYINGKLVDNNGNPSHSYLNYGETMYVGYRYYETRYEDFVLGRGNTGDYDYDTTVVYPFGYGLSYTQFTWSDFNVTYDSATDEFTATIKVKNTGNAAGKDVVELYTQSPYTQYDIDNKIEKPSVSLAGFAKTSLLEPGAEEEIKITVERQLLASYDYLNNGAYLLEASSDYYFTAATDAHSAVNNILAAKNADQSKMSGAGSTDLVWQYSVDETVTYNEAVTGETIVNHFDDARAEDAVYLSRSNWAQMDDNGLRYATGEQTGVSNANVTGSERLIYTHEASDELAAKLTTNSWEASGNPNSQNSYPEVTVDNGGHMQLQTLIGAEYDDPRWETLLDQLKASEMHTLYNQSGYCTQPIESIGKPNTYDYDGPSGISNFLNKFSPYGYCSEITLASTWNQELALQFGEFIGEDGLKTNTTGWYAPAMNTHRTPFSGRNFEYYSEDPILAGLMAAQTTIGVQSKGMYTYMKHFAVNDQEVNRSDVGAVAVWLTEQSLREIYLRPFQLAVEKGGSRAVMTSMTRIGARSCFGNYPLITEVLREEWGFVGMVITDYCMGIGSGFSDQIIAAGGDMILSTAGERLTSVKGDNRSLTELRRATKNILYTVANSAGMSATTGFPIFMIILIVFDVIVGVGLVVCAGLFIVKPIIKGKKEKSAGQ